MLLYYFFALCLAYLHIHIYTFESFDWGEGEKKAEKEGRGREMKGRTDGRMQPQTPRDPRNEKRSSVEREEWDTTTL